MTTNFTQGSLLISGYPAGTGVLGWPYSSLQNSTDGQGLISEVTVGNPAAGVDWTYLVPAGLRQSILMFRGTLTSSATVGTRQSFGVVTDGVNDLTAAIADGNQTASVAQPYYFSNSPAAANNPAAAISIRMGIPVKLAAGQGVGTFTSSIQAGDQWSLIRVLVESWVDNQ